MKGRKRTPTATIKLKEGKVYGTKWGNRDLEPQPEAGVPDCPIELTGVAKQAWDRLCPLLSSVGCLTKQDGYTLALACQMYAVAVDPETPETTRANAIREWRQLSGLFGLSPADRARIQVQKQAAGGRTDSRDRSKDKKAS